MSGIQERSPRMSESTANLILARLRRLEERMDKLEATHEAIQEDLRRMEARMDAKGWINPLQSGSYISPLSSIHLPASIPPIAINHAGMRDVIIVKGKESIVHEEVEREPEPFMEEFKVEPCEVHVAVEPRFKSLPSIKPSSLTSLATPWLDATPIIVSCFPFQFLDDRDMNHEERDASLSKSSKGVFLRDRAIKCSK